MVSKTSSGLLRAKQTADIIAEKLGFAGDSGKNGNTSGVDEYDPLLNEGRPCVMHPGAGVDFMKRPDDLDSSKLAKLGTDPPRIEAAFRKYVHRKENWKRKEGKKEKVTEIYTGRSDSTGGTGGGENSSDGAAKKEVKHEYEIIVCHMNVIRYFVCRALQIPPEAWLRFRGDNCGITEIIVYDDGRVSLARFADQGHLTIEETTFH
eukprot:g3168.t1